MTKLDFSFDVRFFPPLQPENVQSFIIAHALNAHDCPHPVDLNGDPRVVAIRVRTSTPAQSESADLYAQWIEECRKLAEEIQQAADAHREALAFRDSESKRLNEITIRLREEWIALRMIPKPVMPVSSRRRK